MTSQKQVPDSLAEVCMRIPQLANPNHCCGTVTKDPAIPGLVVKLIKRNMWLEILQFLRRKRNAISPNRSRFAWVIPSNDHFSSLINYWILIQTWQLQQQWFWSNMVTWMESWYFTQGFVIFQDFQITTKHISTQTLPEFPANSSQPPKMVVPRG